MVMHNERVIVVNLDRGKSRTLPRIRTSYDSGSIWSSDIHYLFRSKAS